MTEPQHYMHFHGPTGEREYTSPEVQAHHVKAEVKAEIANKPYKDKPWKCSQSWIGGRISDKSKLDKHQWELGLRLYKRSDILAEIQQKAEAEKAKKAAEKKEKDDAEKKRKAQDEDEKKEKDEAEKARKEQAETEKKEKDDDEKRRKADQAKEKKEKDAKWKTDRQDRETEYKKKLAKMYGSVWVPVTGISMDTELRK